MLIPSTAFARLATGLSGITVGSYCAYTAYANGASLGHGLDGAAFGGAFAAVVIGSWFLLPIAAQAQADGHKARGWTIKIGWLLCLAFVLTNAVGFTATHRGDKVAGNSSAITAYDTAVAKAAQLRTELATMKSNKRWEATAGCSDATAEKSRDFCTEVKRVQRDLDRAETDSKAGRPGAVDAQAESVGWVLRLEPATVSKALPIFMAIELDIAASLFLFAAMPPQKCNIATIDVTPMQVANPSSQDVAKSSLAIAKAKMAENKALQSPVAKPANGTSAITLQDLTANIR